MFLNFWRKYEFYESCGFILFSLRASVFLRRKPGTEVSGFAKSDTSKQKIMSFAPDFDLKTAQTMQDETQEAVLVRGKYLISPVPMEAGRRLPQEMEEASLRLWPSYARISKKLPFDLEWFTVFGKNVPQPLSGPLPPLRPCRKHRLIVKGRITVRKILLIPLFFRIFQSESCSPHQIVSAEGNILNGSSQIPFSARIIGFKRTCSIL